MRENLVYRPGLQNSNFGSKYVNMMNMQNSTLPKFEISIFSKLSFGKMKNLDSKTKILKNLDSKTKSLVKNLDLRKLKICTSKPEIRF